jgi:negative regulator of flagellin synthesis FlgM
MDIKKVGVFDKIFGVNKKKPLKENTEVKKDSINISDEAKMMADITKYKEVIKKMPDIRAEKVAEIKQKLKDESYMSKEVYNSVSKKLSDFLEI